MRVVLTLFVGILGIVIGYCAAAVIGDWLTSLAGMSNFEGGRGMFVVFILAPIGAFIGLIAGCIIGWKLGGGPPTPNSVLLLLILSIFAVGCVWELFVMG